MAGTSARDFRAALQRFSNDAKQRVLDVAQLAFEEVTRSVVEGSTITGAPGQPVDTGNLRSSWQQSDVSPYVREISTNVEYAPYIEDGGNDVAAFTLRSEVGGFHSVKLTEAAWGDIVEVARKRVAGPLP